MKKTQGESLPENIHRYQLPNGAKLLVKEDPTTPVVSLNIWVEAGSIDEKADERGMAHLIEHMIFKGTAKRGVGTISREVESAGGYLNAFTSFEHTCFYVVLPGDRISTALDVEFDAYFNSSFDAGELEKEKEVVFEEMRMRRDDPWSWSWELLFKNIFQKNPYHFPVIGDQEILKKTKRNQLVAYYKNHYVPKNTVIAVVGNVSASSVYEQMEGYFKKGSPAKAPRRVFKTDSEPTKLRLHLEAGDIKQTYASLGFPTVPIFHPDGPALEILDSILGEGGSSRLNLAIREKKQSADEVGTDHFIGKFGGSFVFQGLTDKHRCEKFLGDLMTEIQNVIDSGVEESELKKVKNRLLASKIFEKQNVDGQAKTLGYWELLGDYRMEDEFLKSLNEVTSEDLKRVAKKYLAPQRAILVLYHPKTENYSKNPAHWQGLLGKAAKNPGVGLSAKQQTAGNIEMIPLAHGAKLLFKRRPGLPLVSLGVFLKGGFVDEGAKLSGVTSLMSKCLLKGTIQRDHSEFSSAIEGLAAHLDPFLEKDYWGMVLDVPTRSFEEAFDLMTEAFLRPSFAEGEIAREKKLQISAIRRFKDDPSEYAMLKSDVLTFSNTPYAHQPMGTIETLKKITPQIVRGWHSRYMTPRNMTWVAVGDIEPKELSLLIDQKLKGLHSSSAKKGHELSIGELNQAEYQESVESKQTTIVLGLRAPRMGSPDYFAFRVMNTMLSGMGGKLFVELREKKSLAYSVHASHDAALRAGIYQIYIGCSPEKVQEAKKGLLKVLKDFTEEKIDPLDLERAKTYMAGLNKMGLQANRSQVYSYGRYEMSGLGCKTVDKIPAIVKAVSADEVRAMAKKYLISDKNTWVLVGPHKKGK